MHTHARLVFYFGIGLDRNGLPIEDRKAADKVKIIARTCARMFGGYSLTSARGGWDNGEEIVEEPAHRLEVFTDDVGNAFLKGRAMAQFIKDALLQESVVFTVEEANLYEV